MKNILEKYIFQTGHGKGLAKMEIISLTHPEAIIDEVEDGFVVEDHITNPIEFLNRMGGIVRITKVIQEGPAAMPINFVQWVASALEREAQGISGKFRFGISMHPKSDKILKKILNDTKRLLKGKIGNLRYVNKDFQNLSSVQAWHEKLLEPKAVELHLFKSEKKWYLVRTVAIQDFEWYSYRDFERPRKDARNGMFPPKLAQMLINISQPESDSTVFDPFCGSGTVLQEALLMNYKTSGSDIDAKQIMDCKENINWLLRETKMNVNPLIFMKDATKLTKDDLPNGKFVIVTESYLGPQMSKAPSEADMNKIQSEIENIYEHFFSNLKKIAPGTKVVFTAPYYKSGNDRFFLPNLHEILKRYTKIEALSEHERPSLFYERKDQIVGREIWKVTI